MKYADLLKMANEYSKNYEIYKESLGRSPFKIYDALMQRLDPPYTSFAFNDGTGTKIMDILYRDNSTQNYTSPNHDLKIDFNKDIFNFCICFNFRIENETVSSYSFYIYINSRYENHEIQYQILDTDELIATPWIEDVNQFCNLILEWLNLQISYDSRSGRKSLPSLKMILEN